MSRVVMVTRQGCHLCEETQAIIEREAPAGEWTLLDVDEDPALRARYSDHVPVVFVDGRLLAYWTLPEGRLAHALQTAEWASPPLL